MIGNKFVNKNILFLLETLQADIFLLVYIRNKLRLLIRLLTVYCVLCITASQKQVNSIRREHLVFGSICKYSMEVEKEQIYIQCFSWGLLVVLSAGSGLAAWMHWSCTDELVRTVFGFKSVEELYPSPSSPPLGLDSADTGQLTKKKTLHGQFQYFQISSARQWEPLKIPRHLAQLLAIRILTPNNAHTPHISVSGIVYSVGNGAKNKFRSCSNGSMNFLTQTWFFPLVKCLMNDDACP